MKNSGAYKTAKKVSKGIKKTVSNADKNVSDLYKKTIYPHTEAGQIDALNKKYNAKQKTVAKQHKQAAAKDYRVKSGGSSVNTASIRKAKNQKISIAKKNIKSRSSTPYKGPTSAAAARKAQKEKDLQNRIRAINSRTVARQKAQKNEINKMNKHLDNAYTTTKKHNDRVRKEEAARKAKAKKVATKVTKIAAKDTATKLAAAKYLVNKASKSPTATAAKSKAKSVASKAEYKVTRAGQKLSNDVKKTGAYKTAKKAYSSAGKAYNSTKKTASDTYKTAKKTYNTAKKKVRKAKKTYNKYAKQVSNYIDWLSK